MGGKQSSDDDVSCGAGTVLDSDTNECVCRSTIHDPKEGQTHMAKASLPKPRDTEFAIIQENEGVRYWEAKENEENKNFGFPGFSRIRIVEK